MNRILKSIIRAILLIALLLVLLAAMLGAYLTVDEYKPQPQEELTLAGEKGELVAIGEEYTIESWNVGYGALGDNADFFMDGGTMVSSATKERVHQNLDGMLRQISTDAPDFLLLQELDRNSTRSHFVDELQYLVDNHEGGLLGRQHTFAYNFKVAFLPYPIPPIGKVEAGLGFFSSRLTSEAERIALPCPFTWPVSTMNLKRCLLVARCPVEGTDKELVLINLHLEAYDDGTGKLAQTNMLKELIMKEIDAGNYVIAGGDFNQAFSNVDSSAYPQHEGLWVPAIIDIDDFGEDIDFYTGDNAPSCRSLDKVLATAQSSDPEDFQYYIIDGFLVSSNISVNEITTRDMRFEFSDHNPLVLKFELTSQSN